jgi:PAS domain S-box-containing protein
MTSDTTIATTGFEGAPVALCVTRQRVIAGCNPAFADLFGYRQDEMLGQSIAMLYPSLQEFRSIGQRGYPRMRKGKRYEDERLMQRKGGELIWCRVSGLSTHADAPALEAVWSFERMPHAPRSADLLTPREREVVAQLASGLTSKETAKAMGLSPRTVEMHRARLLKKFGVRTTVQLLAQMV